MVQIEELWRTFREPLGAFLRARVHNEADAEDLLSEVFLKLHERADELDEVDDPRAWLYQVTRNAVVDRYRRDAHREHPAPLFDLPAELPEDDASELARCVERLMLALPESDRRALHLLAEGLSQRELAEREGLSPTGARSRVQRARRRLGEAFRACCRLEFDGTGRVIEWRKHRRPDDDGPDCSRPDC